MSEMKRRTIPRDISWLAFNGRVLQEAADPSVPLRERVRFLGIFSNNLDEFFRVRVAALNRMKEFSGKGKLNMHMETAPDKILLEIQSIVLQQQERFDEIWRNIYTEMKNEKIFLITERDLNKDQQKFVQNYFEEEARANIIPLMIQSIPQFPYLREKSLYLGVVLSRKTTEKEEKKFAVIEIPSRVLGRFVILPSPSPEEHHIILLEDIIRYNLKNIFSYFGYDRYRSWVFKVTKDAEIDIDNDLSTSLMEKIEKGLKNRRKGKFVRFIYDKEMDIDLLDFLIRGLSLAKKGTIIPGGRIHNFRHFMDFPDVFTRKGQRKKPFPHPLVGRSPRITDIVMEQDVMLHFPYHSFNTVIDMLREAAIDPEVTAIKVTCYRLASNSKVINALINAVRNGKQVTAMMGGLQGRVVPMQTPFNQHLGDQPMLEAGPACPAEPIDDFSDPKIFGERADAIEGRAADQHGPCDPALERAQLLHLQRAPLRLRQLRAREGAHQAQYEIDRRIGIQHGGLKRKLVRGPAVVGVEEGDDGRGRASDARIARGGGAAVVAALDLDRSAEPRRDVGRAVGRPVVDDDDAMRGMVLRKYARQRFVQIARGIERRDDDVDRVHRVSPRPRRRCRD